MTMYDKAAVTFKQIGRYHYMHLYLPLGWLAYYKVISWTMNHSLNVNPYHANIESD